MELTDVMVGSWGPQFLGKNKKIANFQVSSSEWAIATDLLLLVQIAYWMSIAPRWYGPSLGTNG